MVINKKGFIKTLEAVIAVILVLGLILVVNTKVEKTEETPEDIKTSMDLILKEVSANETFRDACIIHTINTFGDCPYLLTTYPCFSSINLFMSGNIPYSYEYSCEICPTAVSCAGSTLPLDRTLFTESIMIAHKQSKVFRIYAWKREV